MEVNRSELERQAKGFFQALFDFSFQHFIAIRLTGVIYVLALLVGVIWSLNNIARAFEVSSGYGVFTLLVLAPLGFLLYAIAVRVLLEMVIALVQVAENTRAILEALHQQGPS